LNEAFDWPIFYEGDLSSLLRSYFTFGTIRLSEVGSNAADLSLEVTETDSVSSGGNLELSFSSSFA